MVGNHIQQARLTDPTGPMDEQHREERLLRIKRRTDKLQLRCSPDELPARREQFTERAGRMLGMAHSHVSDGTRALKLWHARSPPRTEGEDAESPATTDPVGIPRDEAVACQPDGTTLSTRRM